MQLFLALCNLPCNRVSPLCNLHVVTDFELLPYLVSTVRPVSSYVVDERFFRASTCNGSYSLFIHAGRCRKFPVAKKSRLCPTKTAMWPYIYFFLSTQMVCRPPHESSLQYHTLWFAITSHNDGLWWLIPKLKLFIHPRACTSLLWWWLL